MAAKNETVNTLEVPAETSATLADVVAFVVEEIEQTEIALAFVEAELADATKTQFNQIYARKRAEYGGVLWAYRAVLDIAEGRNTGESTDSTGLDSTGDS